MICLHLMLCVTFLAYDTVKGSFDGDVGIVDGCLVTARTRAQMCQQRDPRQVPWQALGVDVVIESTGVLCSGSQLMGHIDAGAASIADGAWARRDRLYGGLRRESSRTIQGTSYCVEC